MTSKRDNEALTRVGPGTAMGEMMRQYWVPALRSSELATDGDPRRLMILGEKLIAFRDSSGRAGIMDHRCPHRCASLFFGRNEENGIRCVYHGWKYDVDGNCVDMANVPADQDFKHKVKAKAYKAAERNGLIWVFMGDQDNVPGLPDIEATLVAEGDNNIDMFLRECSWLQALEGDLDTSHVEFLHGGQRTATDYPKSDPRHWGTVHWDPEYAVAETDYGMMYGAYRPADPGSTYWRIAHFMFPFWSITPSAPFGDQVYARAWVPLDDTHAMSIRIVWKQGRLNTLAKTMDPDAVLGNLGRRPNSTDWFGRWRLEANQGNDYLIDRGVQRDKTYSGIHGISEQDQMVTESMGAITDRSLEHLAPSDQMITATRRRLIGAVKALKSRGKVPPGAQNPDGFYQARGGYFVAPDGDDMAALYRRRLEITRAEHLFETAAQ